MLRASREMSAFQAGHPPEGTWNRGHKNRVKYLWLSGLSVLRRLEGLVVRQKRNPRGWGRHYLALFEASQHESQGALWIGRAEDTPSLRC